MSVEIKGLDSLRRKLQSLGGDIEKATARGVASASEGIRESAVEHCPKDTGDLRESVYLKIVRSKGTITGFIGTNVEYAACVEFGTGPTGNGTYPYPVSGLVYKADKWRVKLPFLETEDDPGIRYISGQHAQPYLYPALLENRKKSVGLIAEELRKGIREAMK